MIYLIAPLPSLSSLKVEMHSGATETLREHKDVSRFCKSAGAFLGGQGIVGVGICHGTTGVYVPGSTTLSQRGQFTNTCAGAMR